MDINNIIFELLTRIQTLERDIIKIKSCLGEDVENKQDYAEQDNFPIAKRDKTRYIYNGAVYLKNRLVLAIVHDYVNANSSLTREKLKQVFKKSLQGSIGVVENSNIAMLRADYKLRYFSKASEILRLCDGDMCVCNQWGILNIAYFLKVARELGFRIEETNTFEGER